MPEDEVTIGTNIEDNRQGRIIRGPAGTINPPRKQPRNEPVNNRPPVSNPAMEN